MKTLKFNELENQDVLEVLKESRRAQKQAYAPYSGYFVGAAIRNIAGSIFSGCNVENVAYTGSHAEYGAVSAMVCSEKELTNIVLVVVSTNDGELPCGNCLQHIRQFAHGNTNLPIFCDNISQNILTVYTLGELMPHAFGSNNKYVTNS